MPEIAGGNWPAGRALFNGTAAGATCHELRGEGKRVGPELGNLVHREPMPEGRARLRAEADGLVAHLHGLTECEFTHLLTAFPLVAAAVKATAVEALCSA